MKKLITLLFLVLSINCLAQHRVTIPVVSTFVTGGGGGGGSTFPGTAVNYTTVANSFIESPSGSWHGTAGTGDQSRGITTTTRAAGTQFNYYFNYDGTSNLNSGIGFNTSSTLPTAFDLASYWMFVQSNGEIYVATSNYGESTSSGRTTAVAGDILRLNIDASDVIRAQVYRSGAWTTLFTFSGTATGALYLTGHTTAATGQGILLSSRYATP